MFFLPLNIREQPKLKRYPTPPRSTVPPNTVELFFVLSLKRRSNQHTDDLTALWLVQLSFKNFFCQAKR